MGRPAVLKVDIIADSRGVKAGVADADRQFGKLGERAKGMGVAVGVGLAAAGTAAVAFGVSAVRAASDVQQSYGALDSVFGKNAGVVRSWADSAAKSVGLAKSEYAGLAAQVGAQLTGMGLSQQKAAGTTSELIKMGADLSATFGGSVSDAVEAVGSLLRGEADPIERYGVSIKQADVNARLAALGQDKLTGAARKQAAATATLALLHDKTKNSVGAFTRETDTLAHQQQVLSAQFDNVKAAVGARLLPIITTLVAFLGTSVVPVVGRLGNSLVTLLGPAITALSALFTGLGGNVTQVRGVMNDLGLGIRAMFRAMQDGDVTSNGLVGAFESIGATIHTSVLPTGRLLVGLFRTQVLPTVRSIGSYVGTVLLPIFLGLVRFVAGTVVPAFQKALVPVLAGVRSYIGQVTAAVERNRPQLEKLAQVVVTVAGFLVRNLLPVIGKVAGLLLGSFGKSISTTLDLLGRMVDVIGSVIDKVRDLANAVKNSPIGKGFGALGKLVPGYAPVHPMGVPLLSGTDLATPLDRLTTAAAGDPVLAGVYGTPGAATLVVVDNRDLSTKLQVDGALDPPAVARQLRQLLDDHAVRLGQLTAYGAGRVA